MTGERTLKCFYIAPQLNTAFSEKFSCFGIPFTQTIAADFTHFAFGNGYCVLRGTVVQQTGSRFKKVTAVNIAPLFRGVVAFHIAMHSGKRR